ncbi:hypothetical protein WNY37_03345 [Henriciella sp. AS95]|uniref:hypothetical protein n=1 Tax=Henriciella sp. AS95 TaxID=3135782 RepID=UPI00316ED3DE
MSRPAGVRNQDFEEKKEALVKAVADYVQSPGIESPSFRQMAIAADTSEPTLRHYFGDRSGVLVAVFKHISETVAHYRESVAEPGDSLRGSVDSYLDSVSQYRRDARYIEAHGLGIRESMVDEAARKAYLDYILTPGIEAIKHKLKGSPNGPKTPEAAHSAAVMLMASSIFAILYQELLNGKEHAPLDVDKYFSHLKIWLKDGYDGNPDALADR